MRALSAKVIRQRYGMDQVAITFDAPCPVTPGSKFTALGYAPRGGGPQYVVSVLGIPLEEVIVVS